MNSKTLNTQYKYYGMWPVAPTPFHDNGEVDYDGMERVLDCMVDQQVQGICILANYSEQFLLSDNEREKLTKLCMKKMIENIKWYHKIGFKKFKKVNEKGFNRVYFQKQLF